MCDHHFVKVYDVPVGFESPAYRDSAWCLRWQCIYCGAYEDDMQEGEL